MKKTFYLNFNVIIVIITSNIISISFLESLILVTLQKVDDRKNVHLSISGIICSYNLFKNVGGLV